GVRRGVWGRGGARGRVRRLRPALESLEMRALLSAGGARSPVHAAAVGSPGPIHAASQLAPNALPPSLGRALASLSVRETSGPASVGAPITFKVTATPGIMG